MNTKMLHMVTMTLVLVGALNWGLVGLFNFNLVSTVLGMGSLLEKVVYVLVGVSAVVEGVSHVGNCKLCGTGKKK